MPQCFLQCPLLVALNYLRIALNFGSGFATNFITSMLHLSDVQRNFPYSLTFLCTRSGVSVRSSGFLGIEKRYPSNLSKVVNAKYSLPPFTINK